MSLMGAEAAQTLQPTVQPLGRFVHGHSEQGQRRCRSHGHGRRTTAGLPGQVVDDAIRDPAINPDAIAADGMFGIALTYTFTGQFARSLGGNHDLTQSVLHRCRERIPN